MMYLTAGRDAARAIQDYSKKLMEITMRISTTDQCLYHIEMHLNGRFFLITHPSHFKGKKGNYLCNWHCKHGNVKFQASYQKHEQKYNKTNQ